MKEMIENRKEAEELQLEDQEALGSITKESLDKMSKEVEKAKRALRTKEEKIEDIVSSQEDQIRQSGFDLKILEIKIKEKKQELSLSDLKIRELKR